MRREKTEDGLLYNQYVDFDRLDLGDYRMSREEDWTTLKDYFTSLGKTGTDLGQAIRDVFGAKPVGYVRQTGNSSVAYDSAITGLCLWWTGPPDSRGILRVDLDSGSISVIPAADFTEQHYGLSVRLIKKG